MKKLGWYEKRKSIIDTEKVYLDIGVKETIKRMMSLRGDTRNYFSNKERKTFDCLKNGNFGFLYGRRSYPIHFVDGKITEENGKTAIIIYTHNNKIARNNRKFDMIYNAILIGIVLAGIIFMIINGFDFSPQDILKILILLFLFILSLIVTRVTTKTEEENSQEDVALMKEEIYNRIEAIKKWDEDTWKI